MSVSATYFKSLLRCFEANNINVEELLVFSGIDNKELGTDRWLSFDKLITTWKAAIQNSKDPHLGVHVGKMFYPGSIGIVGNIMQVSPNLATALKKMNQYHSLMGAMFDYTKEPLTEAVRIKVEINPLVLDKAIERHAITAEIVALVNCMRVLTNTCIRPEEVTFTFSSNGNAEVDYFNCPVRYNEGCNSVTIGCEYLLMELPTEDTDINELLETKAKFLLSQIQLGELYSEKARRLMLRNINDGKICSIESIAEMLNLSVRTLQRKLKEESTTYNNLIEKVTYELSSRHLKTSTQLTISQISYALGFSDPCIFSRFFKRKSGLTPEEYRHLEKPISILA